MDPGTITTSILVAVGAFILKEFAFWLRYAIPKSVQCWFCHHQTQVPYKSSNSWNCPSCEQYNGFGEDGDYNKTLSRQHEESLNYSVTTQGRCKNGWKPGNQLCEMCNHNQALKVRLLAEFVPINERNYNQEIEHYKTQLEKCHKLCNKCEQLLYRIFKGEREDFAVPRKLNANRKVGLSGKPVLVLNLILSLFLTVFAYLKVQGVEIQWEKYSTSLGIDLILNYQSVQLILNTFPKWFLVFTQANILLIIGFLTNTVAALQTQSNLLILNCASWAINLFLNIYSDDMKIWILSLQAISGVFSCLISTHLIFNKSPIPKSKVELKPKYNMYANQINSPATSTPAVTPNQSYAQFEENITPKRVEKTTHNWRREDSLEPRIRGLNIGSTKSEKNLINESTFNQYSEDFVSSAGAWWGLPTPNNSASTINSKTSTFRKRKNLVSPTRFSPESSRPTSNLGSTYAPSLVDSRRDIDCISNPADDCISCSGHSVQCRHFPPSYPSPYPLNCYYPPPLNYPPYPPPQGNTNLWTNACLIPMLALVVCNAGLLYSIFAKNSFVS